MLGLGSGVAVTLGSALGIGRIEAGSGMSTLAGRAMIGFVLGAFFSTTASSFAAFLAVAFFAAVFAAAFFAAGFFAAGFLAAVFFAAAFGAAFFAAGF
ncbi:hypothetical protein QMT40_002965 [Parvibaculaceae bacterium PLY_AMNH_Bact1]|nr:hypothetical protein QMT40_002965 [Parvibaculaceae bacterium PLY_AMNH_Bact1]